MNQDKKAQEREMLMLSIDGISRQLRLSGLNLDQRLTLHEQRRQMRQRLKEIAEPDPKGKP